MHNLIDKSYDKNVLFIEDINGLETVKDLSTKKLCIIKTNFQNLNILKKIYTRYPNLEIWLTSNGVSRKNILTANHFGIKTVIPYPFDIKIISDFFNKKNKIENKKFVYENQPWLNGLKVMIVDDNPMNVELLAETLASSGLDITTFLKPLDAAEASTKEKFDMFLLDIMMPEMSGFDLAKVIKKTPENSDTPIMFISALSDSETKIAGYRLGSCAYIEKPFDVNVVRSQIFNTLKTKQLNEAMNNQKETFVAMVTHDLKSPINAEIAALELLMKNYEHSTDDFKKEVVVDVLGSTKYMKNLVDNVLNKYKIDRKELSLTKEMHSLNLLIIESIEETKYNMNEKSQKINFANKSKNKNIMIDYLEIKRVFHNLLFNASEYAPRNTPIELELSENKKYMVFSIKNQSKNIEGINFNEIFDEFISYANRHKRLGSGLGLNIAKKIVEAHGGSISVDIKTSGYVRFVFTLPKQ